MYNELKKFKDEEIRGVVGYENYYLVSNYGRVFSLNYRRKRIVHELAYSFLLDKRRSSETMYVRSKMWHINKSTPTAIHRLVALTFVNNEDPSNRKFVNHINGDKSDNRSCNLEWVSESENQTHAFKNGLHISKKGIDHFNHKINDEIATEIIKMISSGADRNHISSALNVSKYIVDDIKRGRTWRHLNVKI